MIYQDFSDATANADANANADADEATAGITKIFHAKHLHQHSMLRKTSKTSSSQSPSQSPTQMQSEIGYQTLSSRVPESKSDGDIREVEEEGPSIPKFMSKLWKLQQPGCERSRIYNLEIEYDSSFCKQYGSTPEGAEAKIRDVINKAAELFNIPGLCLKLENSIIRGSCDGANEETDPLKKTAELTDRQERLQDFRRYYNSQHAGTDKSGAYMFTALGMDDGYIGNAFVNTTCRKSLPYGVVVFNEPELTPSHHILLVHELGHTIGANHFNGLDQYIMNERIKQSCNGFHPTTIQAMTDELNRGCLSLTPIPQGSAAQIAIGPSIAAFFVLVVGFIVCRGKKPKCPKKPGIDDSDDESDDEFYQNDKELKEEEEMDKSDENENNQETLTVDHGVKPDVK